MDVIIENIPTDLRARNQWVLWKFVDRDGKRTKMPVNPKTLGNASVTDSVTWSSFDFAVARWEKNPTKVQGIGFVFTAADPFTGIDLDGCRDEQGQLSLEAISIIRSIGSYTEVSPSQRGVKIFLRGRMGVPKGFRSRGPEGIKNVECYDHSRFFTVTGQRVVDAPAEVCESPNAIQSLVQRFGPRTQRPAWLDPTLERLSTPAMASALFDVDVVDRARKLWGDSFDRLYVRGDLSVCGGDHSSMDWKLVNMLIEPTRGDAKQIDRVFRASALMRPKWDERRGASTWGAQTIQNALAEYASKRARSDKCSVVSRNDGDVLTNPIDRTPLPHTDAGNGERVARQMRDRLRFDAGRGSWRVWDGRTWRLDTAGESLRIAVEAMRDSVGLETEHADIHAKKLAADWAKKSESHGHLRAALDLAKAQPGMALAPDAWDADPWLMRVSNGVLNLRTGTLSPHTPDHAITKQADVVFDESAVCPRWHRFLQETFAGRMDVVNFLRRWFGLCLTGDASEQRLAIFVGQGANGKSTLLECIAGLMRDYACSAAPDLLSVRPNDEHPTELADLCGVRMVSASESERGSALRESRVKRLTGDAKIKARYMHGDFFEFSRTFKMILVCNSVPAITDRTESMRRRLLIVRFPVVVPEHRRNTKLAGELALERSGILNWLLRGLAEWREHGLDVPADVANGLGACAPTRDSVELFLGERCVFDPAAATLSSLMEAAFREFCVANNLSCTLGKLQQGLRRRGADTTRSKKARSWRGVVLRKAHAHE